MALAVLAPISDSWGAIAHDEASMGGAYQQPVNWLLYYFLEQRPHMVAILVITVNNEQDSPSITMTPESRRRSKYEESGGRVALETCGVTVIIPNSQFYTPVASPSSPSSPSSPTKATTLNLSN
jgi:hypothetical protein